VNPSTKEPMADVRDMYMVHTMLRRELGLLPQLVRDVAPEDTRRSEVVGAHASFVCGLLHLHHEGEDVFLWPLLHQRGGKEAQDIVPVMEQQHQGIESANAKVLRLLPRWRSTARGGDELAEAFVRLETAVLEHMAMEEERILPLAEKYVTAAEWRRLGEHSLEKSSKKTLPLAFGMAMYEGDPEVVRALLAEAPPVARLLMHAVARRRFARHAKRVHGTPTPPRATR